MRDLKDEIEEARERVAFCRIRAERPGSRLEEAFALEKARNRLLTLELRQMKHGGGRGQAEQAAAKTTGRQQTGRSRSIPKRTKQEQMPGSARDRAEAAFASLQGNARATTLVLGRKGNG